MNVLEKFRLDGKVIIITGGAGLLGSEYAKAIREAGGVAVAADIKTGVNIYPVDVADKRSVKRLVNKVVKEYGRIDGLVNNAAVDAKMDRLRKSENKYLFEEYPQELWNKNLEVNLTSMFLCAQAVAPIMLDQKSGIIVNVASTYALVGPDQRLYEEGTVKPVAYPVSKTAVIGLTKYLATYWAGCNIRVNTLIPHGVFDGHDKRFVSRFKKRSPLARMAEKDEFSAGLIFLLSDASSYMTGCSLVMDGGWTAW